MHHIHVPAMHPSANGAAERIVQYIKRNLAKLVNNLVNHWESVLPAARQAYMNRVHSATGFSPNHRLFGIRPRVAVETFQRRFKLLLSSPFLSM